MLRLQWRETFQSAVKIHTKVASLNFKFQNLSFFYKTLKSNIAPNEEKENLPIQIRSETAKHRAK